MSSKNYTEEQFIEAVSQSFSYSDVCRKLGINPKGGNLKTVKEKIEKLGLDKSHFTGQRWNKGKTSKDHSSIRRRDIFEVLKKDGLKWTSSAIRQRLIEDGIKEAKCECCGRTEWFGVPIALELHHINEDHYDNRLENLLILCPNCHALTDSHNSIEQLNKVINDYIEVGSKVQKALLEAKILKEKELEQRNKKVPEKVENERKVAPKLVLSKPKKCPICGEEFYPKSNTQKYCSQECSHKANGSKRPDVFELINKFKKFKSFTQVGSFYGVSDNAVRKWCKLYNLPIKSKEMKEYIENC